MVGAFFGFVSYVVLLVLGVDSVCFVASCCGGQFFVMCVCFCLHFVCGCVVCWLHLFVWWFCALVCWFACLSAVCLFVFVCLFVCLFACLFVCLSFVCLFVCSFVVVCVCVVVVCASVSFVCLRCWLVLGGWLCLSMILASSTRDTSHYIICSSLRCDLEGGDYELASKKK